MPEPCTPFLTIIGPSCTAASSYAPFRRLRPGHLSTPLLLEHFSLEALVLTPTTQITLHPSLRIHTASRLSLQGGYLTCASLLSSESACMRPHSHICKYTHTLTLQIQPSFLHRLSPKTILSSLTATVPERVSNLAVYSNSERLLACYKGRCYENTRSKHQARSIP